MSCDLFLPFMTVSWSRKFATVAALFYICSTILRLSLLAGPAVENMASSSGAEHFGS
jgi:hypothetical protein